MTTFQRARKTDTLRKVTSVGMIVLFVVFSITFWKMLLANGLLLIAAVGAFLVVLIRSLDQILDRSILTIDESGISFSGYLWPMDNWKVSWDAVTRARLFGKGQPTLIVLDTQQSTRMVTDYESFEQVVQLVCAELEKRGKPVERK